MAALESVQRSCIICLPNDLGFTDCPWETCKTIVGPYKFIYSRIYIREALIDLMCPGWGLRPPIGFRVLLLSHKD